MLEKILDKEVKGIITGSLIGVKTISLRTGSGINSVYKEDIIIYEITKNNGEIVLGYLKQNKAPQISNGTPITIYIPRLIGLFSLEFDIAELPDEFNNLKNTITHKDTFTVSKINKYKLN